jgi:NAD(P)-dependent dehydrogenase (short-subunit alcohol dehydrogenase family)
MSTAGNERRVLVAGADRGSGAGIVAEFERRGWAVTTCTAQEVRDGAAIGDDPLHAVVANHLGYDLLPGEPDAAFDWQADLAALLALAQTTAPLLEAGAGALVVVTFSSHFVDPRPAS